MEALRAIESRRPAEESRRLGQAESCKLGCLEVGGDPVGLLDFSGQKFRRLGRQAEAQVDGGLKLAFEGLVIDAECRLERGDHVADYIFGRIMQKGSKARMTVEIVFRMNEQGLHQKTVLRH